MTKRAEQLEELVPDLVRVALLLAGGRGNSRPYREALVLCGA